MTGQGKALPWHCPPPTAPQLEVVRLGLGLGLIGWLVTVAPDLQFFYGPASPVVMEALGEVHATPLRLRLLATLEPGTLVACHALFLGVVIAWTLGWRTAITSWLVWFGLLAYWHRNPAIVYGPDRLVAAFLPVLCCAPLDRWLAIRRRPASAREPLHAVRAKTCLAILRLQMAVVFFWTAAQKLRGPLWWSGEATWVALHNVGLAPATASMHLWLADHFWVLNLVTYLTVAVELAYPFLIWRRTTRPWVLGAALCFHFATAVVLGLWFFACIAAAAHLVFLPRRWLSPGDAGAAQGWRSPAQPRLAARQA